MSSEPLYALAEALFEAYSRNSGQNPCEHFDRSAAEQWMAQALVDVGVAELVEAATQAKRAYWLARNSAAGLTNYCEESGSTRRCERELSEAESLWRIAGLDAALARFGAKT